MNIQLAPNHELRFEALEPLRIKVTKGNCEIKGEELLLNKIYEFENTKSFIFAHEESSIIIEGQKFEHYVTDNTNVLQILRFMRMCLKNDVTPNFKHVTADLSLIFEKNVFIVLGQGKSTFVHTIANYLIRLGKNVLVTNLNPKTGFLVFPGCISSCLCTKLLTNQPETADIPLTFFYGSTDLSFNLDYYKEILKNLDDILSKKEFDFHFIIASEEILEHINGLKAYDGCKIVLKDEKLFNKLQDDRILITNGAYEEKSNINGFFSSKNHAMYNIKVWSKVVRIGEEFMAPESALPIGSERKIETNVVTEVIPRKNMVLGASYAETEEDVAKMPVKSFVVVNEIGNGFLKVQSPQPSLKAQYLVQGDLFL